MIAAFPTVSKTALADATMLTHPKPCAPIVLTSDASDRAVGVVMEQRVSGSRYPLAYFSKQLRPPEQKYKTINRQLLGLCVVVRHLRFYLEWGPFKIFTHHEPLLGTMPKGSDPWSTLQQQNLASVSDFSTDHTHTHTSLGSSSRTTNTLNNVILGKHYMVMAQTQTHDADIQAY